MAFEEDAHAKPTKTKKGKKSKKKTGPSMDDAAGQDVEAGGFAPGTKDSSSSEVEVLEDPNLKKKPKTDGPAEEVVLEEEDDAPVESNEPEGPPSPFSLNWIGLTITQSALIYSNVPNVCPAVDNNGKDVLGEGGYSCRDVSGEHKGAVYAGGGNEVQGGFGVADLRFTLGYDRVVAGNWFIGARFGVAILQSPAVRGTVRPMPFHAEARVSYYFGESPFLRQGLRPYVGIAPGIGEIDGKVSVVYYKDHVGFQNNRPGRLDVWRKTGAFFLSLNAGLSYPLGDFMLSGELRLIQAIYAYPGTAPALALNLSYGF